MSSPLTLLALRGIDPTAAASALGSEAECDEALRKLKALVREIGNRRLELVCASSHRMEDLVMTHEIMHKQTLERSICDEGDIHHGEATFEVGVGRARVCVEWYERVPCKRPIFGCRLFDPGEFDMSLSHEGGGTCWKLLLGSNIKDHLKGFDRHAEFDIERETYDLEAARGLLEDSGVRAWTEVVHAGKRKKRQQQEEGKAEQEESGKEVRYEWPEDSSEADELAGSDEGQAALGSFLSELTRVVLGRMAEAAPGGLGRQAELLFLDEATVQGRREMHAALARWRLMRFDAWFKGRRRSPAGSTG